MIAANDPNWSNEERELLIDRAVEIYMAKRRTAVFTTAGTEISHEIDSVSTPLSMSEDESDTSSGSDKED